MIAAKMIQLGKKRTSIRELFEYGVQRSAVVGKENIFDYSIGNPSVPAPEEIREILRDLLQEDSLMLHGYTAASGRDAAREAIARDLSQRTGTTVRSERIYLTCGAAPAIISAIKALAVPGAEIMALAPYFPEYPMYIKFSGAKMVVVPPDTDAFQISIDQVEEQLTRHTQAIIVNSPNNPSGMIYSTQTLEKLAKLLTRKSYEYGHPIYIISDEPYRELVFDGAEVPYIPKIYPNTVICYSYSKSLSLPGERIGYVYVPDCAADSSDLFAAVVGASRTLGHVCAPSLMQLVIARSTELRPDVAVYDRNRKLLYGALTKMGYECVNPMGAFYMLVKAPGGNAKLFSEQAKRENLLIVPGDEFGCPGYCRMSICVDYDMICRSLPVFERLLQKTTGKSKS